MENQEQDLRVTGEKYLGYTRCHSGPGWEVMLWPASTLSLVRVQYHKHGKKILNSLCIH